MPKVYSQESMKGLLNVKYYKILKNKYEISDENTIDNLSQSMILHKFHDKNVIFTYPDNYDYSGIVNLLYENLSKQVFLNYAEIKDFEEGDRLKKINEKKSNIYYIDKIKDNKYYLKLEKDSSLQIESTFDKLKRNYAIITKDKKGTRSSTIKRFYDYFSDINTFTNFTPKYFSKKVVLIAKQSVWNNLVNKDKIPSIYLPNTKDSKQTKCKSIDALEDCICYVTPKYEVCYEEILKNNVGVDTVVLCNSDIDSIYQVIQDQHKYKFKLIILSNASVDCNIDNALCWNWTAEEIKLLNNVADNRVDISIIEDPILDTLIEHYENSLKYVSSLDVPIVINNYSYYLKLALNSIDSQKLEYLLMRLENNRELENNEGGYEDFGDNNPKNALRNILIYLKNNNKKSTIIEEITNKKNKKRILVADKYDLDYLYQKYSNDWVVSNKELKKYIKDGKIKDNQLIFYTFNGKKDLFFLRSLENDIVLYLYDQEKELFNNQLNKYKLLLEKELQSEDRYVLSGIKYKPIETIECNVIESLDRLIQRLDELPNTAYEEYKNESDSILDDIEERMDYKISLNNTSIILESNEAVYDSKGYLLKVYKLRKGDNIRIYPKEQLAENMLQVAIDIEPEIFGKIENDSIRLHNIIKELYNKYNDKSRMYEMLRNHGLRVLLPTIDNYYHGYSKFPMFDSDIRAILRVAQIEDENDIYLSIKRSKRLYNSTMIALGRGIKQELQIFLTKGIVGDLLQKKHFTKETLQSFIDKNMPLLKVTDIEITNTNEEL